MHMFEAQFNSVQVIKPIIVYFFKVVLFWLEIFWYPSSTSFQSGHRRIESKRKNSQYIHVEKKTIRYFSKSHVYL